MTVNSRPLRIGITLVSFPAPSETFIVTKVLGLLDAGFDVTIFAGAESPHWNRFEILVGREDVKQRIRYAAPTKSPAHIILRGIPYLLGKLLQHPADFARFVAFSWINRRKTPHGFLRGFYLRSVYIGEQLDILHFEFDMQALGMADIKEYLGCKLLISARGTIQNSRIFYRLPDLDRWLFQYADGYHFISRFLRNNLLKLGLPSDAPWWLIEPAVDLRLFNHPQPEKTQGDCIRILSVGRLAWEKGYEFALDAVAYVVQAGIAVKYTILGEGDYRDAILFAANQHNLIQKGVVILEGAVPRERVLEYYRQSDILIHAALAEGFCNAVIEAQAMGIPVVTSDAGGLPENVEDGVTGFVVPRRDPRAMAEKIILLVRDPALRSRMGAAGRERVKTHFDLAKQVQEFAALYQELSITPNRSSDTSTFHLTG